jgi:hypothetical protein
VAPQLGRIALAIAALGIIALTVTQALTIGIVRASDRAASLDAVIPAGACALADAPADLITANRFVSERHGCGDNITDPYGTTISHGGRTPATVAVWLHAFRNSDYIVLYSLRNGRIPLGSSLRAELDGQFRLVPTAGLLVYVRDGLPLISKSHGGSATAWVQATARHGSSRGADAKRGLESASAGRPRPAPAGGLY